MLTLHDSALKDVNCACCEAERAAPRRPCAANLSVNAIKRLKRHMQQAVLPKAAPDISELLNGMRNQPYVRAWDEAPWQSHDREADTRPTHMQSCLPGEGVASRSPAWPAPRRYRGTRT